MSRRFILGIVALAAFAVVAGGAFIGAGNPNIPTAADESAKINNEVTGLTELKLFPEEAAQLPLVEAKRKIEKLWKELGLADYPAGRFDNDESLTLFYKGELPPEVSTLIGQLRSGVQIDVVNSPYSLGELMAEAKRLVELNSTETGVTITEAGPLPDFSGIGVAVESPGQHLDAQQLELASRAIQSPVRLEFAVSPKNEPLAGRWDDTSPFWGGGAIDHPTGWFQYKYCTTGFAVYEGWPGGPERMLTANHCGLGDDWRTPDGDLLVGTLGSPSSCFKDTASLTVAGSNPYAGYVFTGPWNSTSAIRVVGAEYPFVGQYVRVSGSWSGEHVVRVESVGNYITSICAPWATGPGFYTVDEQQDGSAGDGDSGGPVYVANGSGVNAVGMINAGDTANNQQPCEGRTASWRNCASRVFHIDINSVLYDINDLSCCVTKLYLQ